MQNRPLSDLVTHPNPVTLPPDATAQEACHMMRAHRVGCILVTDADHRLLGIFTGRDVVGLAAECRPMGETHLADVMTRHPLTLPPGATAIEALRLMQDGGFRHVPLVSGGRVVGIVSRWDFRAMEHARLNDETGLWECMR